MATFHDLKHIVKDTIAVDAKQRYTPQEVKFINRNNEFYGIFHGKVDATKLLVSNAELSGCTIFDENGVSVDVSKLGKSQEEIKELIESLNGELYGLSANTKEWINEAVSNSSGSVIDDVNSTIESISTSLSNDIQRLETGVSEISNDLNARVTKNEADINDIKEKQVGAISYHGVMRVLSGDTTFHDIFFRNFNDHPTESGEIEKTVLEKGWMWCIQADDKKKHYPVEGEFIEHGDFIVVNKDVKVKDVNKECVDILDMMDFDLQCDTKLDLDSVNPVQNKVITNEIESLKQIMTGIDERVEYVGGLLSAVPAVDDYSVNQVIKVELSNGIQTDYILCENDDGEKYWKQYVVDGIFERKEFRNQYVDSSAKAIDQLSDSNENYPSSRLTRKLYEDLAKTDDDLEDLLTANVDSLANIVYDLSTQLSNGIDEAKSGLTARLDAVETSVGGLSDAISAETSDRKSSIDSLSTKIFQKIDDTKTYLENADSRISSDLTTLISAEVSDRTASIESLSGWTLTSINDVYDELTSNYSELTSAIASAVQARIDAENAILTSLNDYMQTETSDRIAGLTALNERIDSCLTSYTELSNKLVSEESDRISKDKELSISVIQEIEARIASDTGLSSAIDTEAEERKAKDESLSSDLTALSSEIEESVNAITNKIEDLSSDLKTELASVSADLTAYIDKTASKLTSDVEQISSSLSSAIDNEISARKSADDEISNAVSSYIEKNDVNVASISTDLSSYKASNDKQIIDIKNTLVGSVRYMGHITLTQELSGLSIGQVISNYVSNSDLSDKTELSNGWMFLVTFGSSIPDSVIELSTADGVVLTQKDYIVIDNHDPDSGVPLSAISRDTIDIIDVVDNAYVKRSEYENAKKDLSDYVDTKFSGLTADNTELTGSHVLKSISQTGGKISVETRSLSIDELENAVSFVDDEISSKLSQISCTDILTSDTPQIITSLSQSNGQIAYQLTSLTMDTVPGLTASLNDLSNNLTSNLECISAVGVVVNAMNGALSSLHNNISACLYVDDGLSTGTKRMKNYEEVDFDDTLCVCFQLMKSLDEIFNPTHNTELTGSISLYASYTEALQVMNKYIH